MLERKVIPDRSGHPALIQVAQDASAIETAAEEFGRELAFFLIALWLVLSSAAWLQVSLGLSPLNRLRAKLSRLEENPSERLDTFGASEVQPLILAINSLAEARERDLGRARRRATDLAHGLKTPLAAISAQARRLRDSGAIEGAQSLQHVLKAMNAVVEAELARTRIASLRVGSDSRASVRNAAEKVVAVLERTEMGQSIVFDLDIPDELMAPVADEILIELFGAIGENAVRFARRHVFFVASKAEGEVMVTIEDDGPGIARDMIRMALLRGARLDESGGGQGLGLAITRELVEATQGKVALSGSKWGGLRVEVRWPSSKPNHHT